MKKFNFKQIFLILFISILVGTNLFTINLYLKEIYVSDSEIVKNTADELSRVKYFIKDWYEEVYQIGENEEVYYNELRFDNGAYTLTIASDRIRAVYPRGERFFQMEYVTYGEFFKENGYTQCRLYYNETGTLIFKLN